MITTKKRTTLAEEIRKGAKILNFGLIMIIVLSLVFFLFSLSKSAYKGYTYRQKEILLNEQIEENNLLKVETLEARSFDQLEQSKQVQGMTKPESYKFVENRIQELTMDSR